MANHETVIWGIHAGKTGDADSLFLKHDVVGLGWPEMGNLKQLGQDRDAFKAAVAKHYPQHKPGAIPNNAGQLFRFVHEMKVGDLVIYPSRNDRQVHIGEVTGEYGHQPELSPAYPNQRHIKWLRNVSRTRFTQGALYEIGSAMSLFQVRNYADEFRAVLDGKAAPTPVSQDESVAAVAEDIEETTRDYILKRLAQELKGHPFAHFVAHLLGTMGYQCRVSPEGTDGGVDIIAHKDELGFEPPIIKVQAKSSEASVSNEMVSALFGTLSPTDHGLFVTLGTFSAPARMYARSRSNLRLIDNEEVVRLIYQHYEQFDSRYKGLLPLKRVYVPAVIDEMEQ